jgi:hypothetical protein
MTPETSLTVDERIRQLLQHLGIRQAHVAGQSPEDWTRLATTLPERCASLTLVGPPALDPHAVGRLASRLLVVRGSGTTGGEGATRRGRCPRCAAGHAS